jgi:zinc finger SWIM domain-containing protein 3
MQASKLYTPVIFEAFQSEYKISMVASITTLEGNNQYHVAIGSLDENLIFEKEYKVTGDPLEQTSICSCGQFDRFGVLCAHALKVLNLMNIKLILAQYVLKRWTREARCGIIQDNQGRTIIETTKLDDMLRYKDMTHRFLNLASRAASDQGYTFLVNRTIGMLSKQVEEQINGSTNNLEPATISMNVAPPSALVGAACHEKY